MTDNSKIPRDPEDDFCDEIVKARQAFIEERTGATLNHSKAYSYDPHVMAGNIENLWESRKYPLVLPGRC